MIDAALALAGPKRTWVAKALLTTGKSSMPSASSASAEYAELSESGSVTLDSPRGSGGDRCGSYTGGNVVLMASTHR